MTDFGKFKTALQAQFKTMKGGKLFKTDIDKDVICETYLNSFPEGTNHIFRERTEHDCQCCKQFIRACGSMVAIVDNKKVSIWDVMIGGYYQDVADVMAELVTSAKIRNIFIHRESKVGTDFNHELKDGNTKRWEHFYIELPAEFVKKGDDIGTATSRALSSKEVFKRGLVEISSEAIETTLELIEQKSIYRGEEHKATVELLQTHKAKFDAIEDEEEKDNYCWLASATLGGASRMRNSVIGTLMTDISDGVELDKAVKSFDTKMAPTNYKRTTAIVTQSMIRNAQKKVEELGIGDSLQRRYAVAKDISITNVLFADRSVKKAMNVFDEMVEDAPVKTASLKKVEEVDADTFFEKILPKADSIELMFENSQVNNLMSLIAPAHEDSKHIFKWDNNFSWAYTGEVADSIKERVKRAGGDVTGDLRASLSWHNHDDLDIHCKEPNGTHISYSSKVSRTSGGKLDVDMNAGSGTTRTPVENITWANKAKMTEGKYEIYVNNYSQRETKDVGFVVEIEFDGVIHTFNYDKRVANRSNVAVATFEYSHKTGIKFIKSLPSTQASKEVWDIPTQKFRKVSMIMNSPNHWDGKKTGNKHWFFILDGCKNDSKARGFFNEFLDEGLRDHRKVFEVLGSKMKTEKSDNQLSGLGFSSTQKSHVLCKVGGSFNRTIKINF